MKQRRCLSEAVQIGEMALRIQQLLPVVLAVDIDELTAQLLHLGNRDRLSVEAADVPSALLDLPLED